MKFVQRQGAWPISGRQQKSSPSTRPCRINSARISSRARASRPRHNERLIFRAIFRATTRRPSRSRPCFFTSTSTKPASRTPSFQRLKPLPRHPSRAPQPDFAWRRTVFSTSAPDTGIASGKKPPFDTAPQPARVAWVNRARSGVPPPPCRSARPPPSSATRVRSPQGNPPPHNRRVARATRAGTGRSGAPPAIPQTAAARWPRGCTAN